MDFRKDWPLHLRAHITSFSFLHYNFLATYLSITLGELRLHPSVYRVYICCANTNLRLNYSFNIHFDRKIQKDYRHHLRLFAYGSGYVPRWHV